MGNSNTVRNNPAPEECALGELPRSLPGNIHFANELHYFWLAGPHGSPERVRRVREAILAKLKASLDGRDQPSRGECLNGDYPHDLFHLFYTSEYQHKAEGLAPLSDDADWAWLRPSLLASCRECPARLLPQVIIALRHDETRER